MSEVTVTLQGGKVLTPDECKTALDEAMKIIELYGTVETDSSEAYQDAQDWMKRYYGRYNL